MSTQGGASEPASGAPQAPAQQDLSKLYYQAVIEGFKLDRQLENEIQKLERQAELNGASADRQATAERQKLGASADMEREKADWAHEYALDQEYHKAYIEVAKGQIERARASADFVQKVAVAASTAYAAILALKFGIGNTPELLPVTGMIPTVFLGLALVYAAFFIAYLTSPQDIPERWLSGTLTAKQKARRDNLIRWITSAALRRPQFLQAAVISLGIGIFFFPIPYLDLSLSLWGISIQWLLAGATVIGVGLTLTPLFWRNPR